GPKAVPLGLDVGIDARPAEGEPGPARVAHRVLSRTDVLRENAALPEGAFLLEVEVFDRCRVVAFGSAGVAAAFGALSADLAATGKLVLASGAGVKAGGGASSTSPAECGTSVDSRRACARTMAIARRWSSQDFVKMWVPSPRATK